MTTSVRSLPAVEALIPAFNEEAYLDRCLRAVRAQTHPRDLVRIIIVDAGSTDGTRRIAEKHAAEDNRIEVVTSTRRLTTPEALNAGLERCTAGLVARVDAHGWPAEDFLSRAIAVHLEEGERVACVGGLPEPVGETRFGQALTLAWTSRFGVGASVYASGGRRRDVLTVPWGTYRREALLEVGSFDPGMLHGEDEDVNWRLTQAGYRVVLDGSIRFSYVSRGSWLSAFRQYRNYGEARMRVVAKHNGFLRPHHLAPALAVGGGAALAALAPFSRLARRTVVAGSGAYAAAAIAAATRASNKDERQLVLVVAAAYAALHCGYGTGLLRGLASHLRRPSLG